MYDLDKIKSDIPIKDLAVRLGLVVVGNSTFCFAHDDKSGKKRSLIFLTRVNRFECKSCGEKGSVIDLAMGVWGLSFKDAIKKLADSYNIQLTGNPPITTPWKKHPATVKPKPEQKPMQQHASVPNDPPSAEWQKAALRYLSYAWINLNHSPKAAEHRKWLAEERGLNETTMQKLGWNFIDMKVELGWLPSGLVIGCIQDGKLHRLKIRRQDVNLYSRYYQVNGSSSIPMRLGNPNSHSAVILEADLDGLLLDQEAGDLVDIISMGTAKTKPDEHLTEILRTKDIILVALDADKAGINALPWWLETFDNAVRLPSLMGKDPCEDWKAGSDIRAWVQAGLHSCHGKYCDSFSIESDYGERIQWCNVASCGVDDLLLADCLPWGCPLGKWTATDEEVNYDKVSIKKRYRI